MRLVDANLLIYAYGPEFPQHERTLPWLEAKLNGTDPLGLPWPTLLAFVRLTSNPRIFKTPMTVSKAWSIAESWLTCPCVWVPSPGPGHQAILSALLNSSGMTANHVPDAHIAALAIEHHLVLCTADKGFARFADLAMECPIP